MLRRLSTLGMRLAEETVERAVNSPYHPEPRHEPCQAFARVSRSVRLTIVLQARFEAGPLAFRNTGGGAGAVARPAPARHDDGGPDPLDPAREDLRERESLDEAGGLTFEGGVRVVVADSDLGSADPAASCDVLDRATAARAAALDAPRATASFHAGGHWFQRDWPDPPKPPDTG